MKSKQIIFLFAVLAYFVLFFQQQFKLSFVDVHLQFNGSNSSGVNKYQLKVIQISDLHAIVNQTGYMSEMKQIVDLVASEMPDFVFITGDFVEYATEDNANWISHVLLHNLTRVLSDQNVTRKQNRQQQQRLFGVIGNHDFKTLNVSQIADADDEYRRKNTVVNILEREGGIRILENESVYIEESKLLITGFGDPFTVGHVSFDPQSVVLPPQDEIKLSIALVHNPDTAACLLNNEKPLIFPITQAIQEKPLLKQRIEFMNRLETKDMCKGIPVDLQLSGHTHGGQLSLPGTTFSLVQFIYEKLSVVAPSIASKLHNRIFSITRHLDWARGLIEFKGEKYNRKQYLYVNSGVHTSKYVRLFCPPEVTIFHLKYE